MHRISNSTIGLFIAAFVCLGLSKYDIIPWLFSVFFLNFVISCAIATAVAKDINWHQDQIWKLEKRVKELEGLVKNLESSGK